MKDTLDAIHEFIKKATTKKTSLEVDTGDAAQDIVENNPQAVPTNVASQGSQGLAETPGAVGVSSYFKAKLPFNLPKFGGNVTNFTSFWDSFQSAIHSNSYLSSVDKFNYLKSYLEGEALRSIEGLPLSEAN